MHKFKAYLVAFLLFVIGSAYAQTPSEKLDSLLSTFKSMSANFEQEAVIKKKVAKKSHGKMALQRPGKFRWEITSPDHQVIIADGKTLWIYDVDLEQVTQQSLHKNAHSPANLLSGSTAALEQRFTILDMKQTGNKILFDLQPKKNQDMVQRVELQFMDNKLYKMAVIDNMGQKNIFYFSHVMVNPSLPAALFQFHAPKGVDIIKNE